MPDAKFDTLAAMQKLQDAGLGERPAKATVTVISESQRNLATKSDLLATKSDLQTEIKLLRTDMEAEFKLVRSDMAAEFKAVRSEMQELRTEMRAELQTAIASLERTMTIRLGGMLLGTAVLTTALTTVLTRLL